MNITHCPFCNDPRENPNGSRILFGCGTECMEPKFGTYMRSGLCRVQRYLKLQEKRYSLTTDVPDTKEKQ